MKSVLLVIAALTLTMAMMAPSTADAEEEEVECRAGEVCQLGEIEIFGDRPWPNVVYVLQPDRLLVRNDQDEQSFTDEIIESVNLAPF